jgi:uncharacterized protein (TIGR03435 family)
MAPHIAPAVLFLLPSIVAAQTPPPEFEVASVKPAPPGTPYGGMRGGPGTSSPGQIVYSSTTLRAVTAKAYGVQRFQIVGPPWFDQQRFDITAKIPPSTTMQQFQLMLQKLLADRFKLELHRENRTASVYDMTIAKTGLKMKESPALEAPAPASGVFPPTAPVGSGLMEMYFEGKAQVRGQRVTMRQFIVWLTQETDLPIVDKTGLTERYDFTMPWTPGNEAATGEASPGAGAGALVFGDVGDTIYSALEKYLGLKLVSRKGPVEMLVIDRLERTPTEN